MIYMRHGRTQYDQIELEHHNRANGTFDLDKCATQRQLSEEGHAEMKVTGEQFRQVGIALDGVFSSRYCRAIESAAFFAESYRCPHRASAVGWYCAGKNSAIVFDSRYRQ